LTVYSYIRPERNKNDPEEAFEVYKLRDFGKFRLVWTIFRPLDRPSNTLGGHSQIKKHTFFGLNEKRKPNKIKASSHIH